jgi:hypothetical protein
METIKNAYILLATVVIILLSVFTCTKEPCLVNGEVISSTTKIDSIRTHSEHYKDSIDEWVHHAYVEVPEITPEEEYHEPFFPPIREHAPESILSVSEDTSKTLRTFYYGKEDSLLKYNIRIIGECKPKKVEMEYDVKKVTIKDSVYVRDSVHVKQVDKVRVNQLYYGVEAVVYPNLQAMFFSVDFVNKKGWQLEGGIGADITDFGNPQVMGKVGLKKLFTLRRKKK